MDICYHDLLRFEYHVERKWTRISTHFIITFINAFVVTVEIAMFSTTCNNNIDDLMHR